MDGDNDSDIESDIESDTENVPVDFVNSVQISH